MRLSDRGRATLEQLEGVVLHPYQDSGGYWTIGVGHLLSALERSRGTIILAGKPIPWRLGLTLAQADALCSQDVGWAEADVTKEVTVALEQRQPQFDALVCWTYNVGPTNLADSHLLRLLNAGLYASVPAQLARWVYLKGKRSNGLVHRRAVEIAMWKGTYV